MRILITGLGGMLGSDLLKILSGSHQVFGIGRKKRKFSSRKVSYFSVNLSDLISLKKCLAKIKPDIVIHSAAKTHVDDCELKPLEAYQQNVLATQNLIEAVKFCRPRFIYVSTDYVFNGSKRSGYSEKDFVGPLNVYGATKLLGERMVQNSGLKWSIIRTSWLYGLNGPNFVTTIMRLAREKKNLKVVSDQNGSPTYTKDLAFAIKRIVEKKNTDGILNVTNFGVTNWNAYAKQILKESGINHVKVGAIKTKASDRPALRPQYSILTGIKFQRTFGSRLRNWQEALKDYLEELKTV